MADMPRHKPARRTPTQAAADRSAELLVRKLGLMLRDARRQRNERTQAACAQIAGISRTRWSDLEAGRDTGATVAILSRAAKAVGGSLDAFIRQASAAGQPRDAVHLRNQELVIRTALSGGWHGLPEEQLDREARTSRFADVLLTRIAHDALTEYALLEVIDWFDDVGAPIRDWSRRLDALERYAVARMGVEQSRPAPRTGGCWVVRATRRNRILIGQHRNFFRTRFPGSGRAWLAALTDRSAPLANESALLWVSVDGKRLFPARWR
jgi:transcriptional regulator with XRE-family HTH domain